MAQRKYTSRMWRLQSASTIGYCVALMVWLFLATGCGRAPEPVALQLSIEEDTSVEISLASTQPKKSSVAYQISQLPQHGSISGNPPTVRYTPDTDFAGTDEIRYVTEQSGGRVSKPAVVTIEVTAVNDAPVAESLFVETQTNTATSIEPIAFDIDGEFIEYEIVVSPRAGEVVRQGLRFIYTPHTNFVGNDRFEYVAIDEPGLRSNNAVVDISISVGSQTTDPIEDFQESATQELPLIESDPLEPEIVQTEEAVGSTKSPDNEPPKSNNLSVTVMEDSTVQVDLSASDPDGTISRFAITSLPANGMLRGNGSRRTYTPTADFHGSDSFSFVAIDNQEAISTPAVVSITVKSVNDPPFADSSHWVTQEDGNGVSIALRASDSDGTVTAYHLVNSPSNGRVHDEGHGSWRYVPNSDFSGYDSFQWHAQDDSGSHSSVATVTLEVIDQPDPPLIQLRRSTFKTTVGESLDVAVHVEDPDGDANWYSIRAIDQTNGFFRPTQGSLSDLRKLRFDATERGISIYQIEVRDQTGLSSTATLTVDVVNTAPIVELPTPSYDRSQGTVKFTLRIRDPDGTIDHFVVQTIDNRRAGNITVNNSTIIDAQPFTTGGLCETQDGAWCTLNVKYEPDTIDGHSRRIRVYAVDNDGSASPKDFIRIETRELEVEQSDEDIEEDEEFSPSPNPPKYPRDMGQNEKLSKDEGDAAPTEEANEDKEETPTAALNQIVDQLEAEEIEELTNPNREVPRERR